MIPCLVDQYADREQVPVPLKGLDWVQIWQGVLSIVLKVGEQAH